MLNTAILKKSAITAITAVALSAVVVAGSVTAADAGKRHRHGGAAAAAGIAGFAAGLALGAGAYGGPVYGGPVIGVPVYGPDCFIEKRKRYNRRGQLVIIKRQVCY